MMPPLGMDPNEFSDRREQTRREFLRRTGSIALASAAATLWPMGLAHAELDALADPKKVASFAQQRQQIEVMMAWELLEVFNTHKGLRNSLLAMATIALEEMITIASVGSTGRKAITAAIKAENGHMGLTPML